MTRIPHNPQGNLDPAAVQRYLDQVARWARSSQSGKPMFSNRRRRARRKFWTMSLNLTPMIDVVFLLLFFFLVVSRFAPREGVLPTQIPARAAAAPTDVPRTPLRIRLVADGTQAEPCMATIDRFHETPIAMSALVAALEQIRDQGIGFDAQTPVHLVAGDHVAWDHVVNAYNAAMAARFEKVYFAGAQ